MEKLEYWNIQKAEYSKRFSLFAFAFILFTLHFSLFTFYFPLYSL